MQQPHRIAGLLGAFAGLALSGAAIAGGPVLRAELPEAVVKVALPANKIETGVNVPFTVSITPASGKPAPTRVRARLGMPMMGHWVTGEESHDFRPELAFDFREHLEMGSAIPMHGLYRLRVWLDYADGREAKTAVDFRVMTGEPLDAVVVE